MTSTETPAVTEEPEAKGWDWIDTAGLIAGGILLLILADVFTDGRLISRRLRGLQQQPAPEPEPVPGE